MYDDGMRCVNQRCPSVDYKPYLEQGVLKGYGVKYSTMIV